MTVARHARRRRMPLRPRRHCSNIRRPLPPRASSPCPARKDAGSPGCRRWFRDHTSDREWQRHRSRRSLSARLPFPYHLGGRWPHRQPWAAARGTASSCRVKRPASLKERSRVAGDGLPNCRKRLDRGGRASPKGTLAGGRRHLPPSPCRRSGPCGRQSFAWRDRLSGGKMN